MALATQDAAPLARRLLDSHREACSNPTCPYVDPGRPLIVAEEFCTDGEHSGGLAHRHHYSDIGTLGEHIVHLVVPEIRLVDRLSGKAEPDDAMPCLVSLQVARTALRYKNTGGRTPYYLLPVQLPTGPARG